MRFPVRSSQRSARCRSDTGSAMPLVIGMVACLLFLGAGVTAATSAFLAHNRLQHACDGAAAAAAGAAKEATMLGRHGVDVGPAATARAVTYLRARGTDVDVLATGNGDGITLTCTTDAPITFGELFGHGTVTLTTDAVGHPILDS